MATTTEGDEHERSAAGMDYDFPMREKASQLGNTIAENGPDAFFEEIENLLPEAWRDQIVAFPLAAVMLGVGVGVWLGMKKGDEVIAAGTSLVTAAAMSNITNVMERATGGGE